MNIDMWVKDSLSSCHCFFSINTNAYLKENVNLTDFVRIFDLGYNTDLTALSNAAKVFSAYNLTMRHMLKLTTEDCDEVKDHLLRK